MATMTEQEQDKSAEALRAVLKPIVGFDSHPACVRSDIDYAIRTIIRVTEVVAPIAAKLDGIREQFECIQSMGISYDTLDLTLYVEDMSEVVPVIQFLARR